MLGRRPGSLTVLRASTSCHVGDEAALDAHSWSRIGTTIFVFVGASVTDPSIVRPTSSLR
jgi:hypothetical protein